MDDGLRLILLGKPQISRDGAPVHGFIYNKALALLAYLAVTRRPHSREALAGLFWGEMRDAAAKANLRKILSALREVAGHELIVDRQTVSIAAGSTYWLDTEVFEAQLQGIAAGSPEGSILSEQEVHRLEEAVSLYRGDFLDGFYVRDAPAFEEWALAERERLRQMALYSHYRLVGHHTAMGDFGRGLGHATRLLALEPWHEEVHQQMMLLLALSGQRSAAMDQFETCRRLLADELGAEPNRDTMDLYQRILRGEISPQKRYVALPRDWPAESTPFVGRARELARLTGYLAAPDSHLATVVGISGVGKTRMLLQAAAQAMRTFGQHVYYVPVAGATTPEAISHNIMHALAMPLTGQHRAWTQLTSRLRDRKLLIVLDQLDPHPGIASFLRELIQQVPGLRMLIASSNRLNLAGEWVLPLYGLEVPRSDDPDEVRSSDAAQLFMRAVQRGCGVCDFEDDQLAHIARICRLVEGIPLGIELAAAWARLLPYHEIAREIDKSYHFLKDSAPAAPERHHSLTAAFDYSWGRMSADERALFRRLSVFRGGFVRQAAEQVAGASLPALAALMDKCLIQRTRAGRFQAHGLFSQYGRQELAKLPQEEIQTYERYCEYYTGFLQRQMGRLDAGLGNAPISEIDGEQENLQAAWRWAVSRIQPSTGAHADNDPTAGRFMAAQAVFAATGGASAQISSRDEDRVT